MDDESNWWIRMERKRQWGMLLPNMDSSFNESTQKGLRKRMSHNLYDNHKVIYGDIREFMINWEKTVKPLT